MSEVLSPINDIVLVDPVTVSGTTEGGIVIPQSAQSSVPIKRGRVFAVGNGQLNDDGTRAKMQVKGGDVIEFLDRQKSPFPKTHGFLIMQERDILVIIKEQE